MSRIFPKNFHHCFSKINCLPTSLSPYLTPEEEQDKEMLYHKDDHHHQHQHQQCVYDVSLSSSSTAATTTTTGDFFSSSSSTSVDEPDLISTVFASQRFFVSSPGLSNSIMDSSSSSSGGSQPDPDPRRIVGGAVSIRKYSPDPYTDFRSSMQEMLEARDQINEERNGNECEYLHELLLCYLTLNPKHTHKFIISAFADLLVSVL